MVGVGSTTLAQHWPYVNILSLAVGSISSWNQYVGPTLGQCTSVTVGCITLDQHWTNVCLPLWFWITVCWKYYVDPTLGQCTPVTYFNRTELRWVYYVGPTLDQRMPATLVLDKSLLKILRWPNVGPMYWWLVLTWPSCVGCITLGQHWTNVCLPLWFWIKVCWKYYVDPTLVQCTTATSFNMTELRWVHYVRPTLDQRKPATLVWIKVCWEYYVDPTLGQCTTATCFNMTELRWVHYVGPTLDQRKPVTFVWIEVCWKYYHDPTLGQSSLDTCFKNMIW